MLKEEIDALVKQGDNNPLTKIKEDILTENLILESKNREIQLLDASNTKVDQEEKWDYWVDEPEFELPKDLEVEEETGFLSVLPSLPSFNFIS